MLYKVLENKYSKKELKWKEALLCPSINPAWGIGANDYSCCGSAENGVRADG